MSNVLHAHLWGDEWTKDMKIIQLTDAQHTALYKACCSTYSQETDIFTDSDFTDVITEIDEYIKTVGCVFFKLSCISPKDSTLVDTDPVLKAYSVEKVLRVLTTSMRVLEDLELYRPAIILKKWSDAIYNGRQYRCFIFDGVCEAIADHSENDAGEFAKPILDYIESKRALLPSQTIAMDVVCAECANCADCTPQVIFIEFNPVDDELDDMGITKRGLSEKAMLYLNRRPVMC